MSEHRTPWEAIGAYLNDQSDKPSEAIVRDWMNESADHIELFKEIVDTRLVTQRIAGFYEPDKERLWNELQQRIQVRTKRPQRIFLPVLKYAAIAAVLVLAFLGGKWVSLTTAPVKSPTAYSTVFAAPGQKTHLILPDSTKVWLNSGSELKYASTFTVGQRDVYISGECYFEVTKNKHKPFVVHGKDIQVKVFGTHFNVKEDAKHRQSEVTLVEGKIQVLDTHDESLTFLTPGEQLKMKNNRYSVRKAENTGALIAWTKGVLIFKNKPFGEVVDYLENWYGVTIHLDDSLSDNHRYTFKVKTESLREILDLISQITPIQYQIEGEQVYIKSKRKS